MNDDLEEYIAQLDPQSKLLYSEVLIGVDAEDFLNTDLGRTMVGFAHQEYVDALLQLAEVPWWRRRKIQKLQRKAQCARWFTGWLKDLIVQGRQAAATIDQSKRSDA